ncbi:MAG: class I SAM-dependent rRNA methyltransferase [Ilumatobacteraceae bacterium]
MAGARGEPRLRPAQGVHLTDRPSSRPGVERRRIAVHITRDAERQVRAGHPWVFDASITSTSHAGAAGDLAVVFDHDRRFLAIGLYDPASPIRVRIVHHGTPEAVDGAFWARRVAAAVERRQPLVEAGGGDGATTGYRVVHGENDGLPGLVVDRYDDTAVIKVYSAAWLAHLDDVVDALHAHVGPARVVLRRSRAVGGGSDVAVAVVGELPDGPVGFLEGGLSFEADVVRGQKTGHFLDQRENRQRVARQAAGRRVLDVFSCTGGFSVHAAAGGAVAVTSVDQSSAALDTARRNMAANSGLAAVAAARHETVTGDAFEVLAHLAGQRRRYDVVVVDPPSFASRRDQVGAALRAYGRLTKLAVAVVEPGGLLVQASCSSRVPADQFATVVHDAAGRAGRPLVEEARTGHPLDHPVGFPEGAYLKALYARVG